MRFETIEHVFDKMEKIIKKGGTLFGKPDNIWEIMVHYDNQIFARHIPIESSCKDDWQKILEVQIEFLKEFMSTSIRFGFFPPLNAEGSLVSIAAYNAAIAKSDIDEGVFNTPSSSEIRQEFYKLLMEKDI